MENYSIGSIFLINNDYFILAKCEQIKNPCACQLVSIEDGNIWSSANLPIFNVDTYDTSIEEMNKHLMGNKFEYIGLAEDLIKIK